MTTTTTEIKVRVITVGGDEREVEVPVDMRAEDFMNELVIALNLPLTDAEGLTIVWRIDNKDTGRTLNRSQTLDENGVRDGHRLLLIRNTTAGVRAG